MGRMGWVYVGSAGALALQLLLVACGNSEKHSATTAGGADNSEAGQSSSGSAGKSSTSGASSSGGSSSGKSSCGSVKPTDLDGFLEGEGDCFCERLFRCAEGDDDFVGERIVLKNVQGCKDLLARVNANSQILRDLRAQIAAGNIHYDPVNGQKCLEDLGTCSGVDSLNEGACREAFEGKAKTGEACARSEDCAGDAYCGTLQECGNKCTPRKQEGEPCQRDNECAYTQGAVFCDHSTATPVCHTLLPTAKAAEGEPCTRNFEGAEALTLCQDGLWCATAPGGDPAADVVGQCAPPIPSDGPCVDGDDFCSDGVCDTALGACRHVTLVAEAGAACDKPAGVGCDPALGLHCNAAGTCDASGDGSEGSACFASDLQRGCDAGLYCAKAPETTSDDPGVCRAFVADGAACSDKRECASGSCTDGVCGGRPCLQ
jgi:hypothetical protein